MTKQLSNEEFLFLSNNLFLLKDKDRDKETSILSKELLDEKICLELLKGLSGVLNSPSLKVTASLLSKRIAFLSTASCLYSMSIYNKGLDLSIDNSYFDFSHDGTLWSSKMPLKSLDTSFCISKRDEFRKKVLKALFADHLKPIWNNLSNLTNISKKILWENTAARVYSLYENKISEEVLLLHHKNIQEDFEFLVSTDDFEIFGEDYNPLKYFYEKKDKRIRKTCCFYYKTTKKKVYCKTCPLG